MAQPQQHSQLPPQYRQALLEQQQRQKQQEQQQQAPQTNQAPTLEQIEKQYSQLPPQYRQAVLEKQQREHQLKMQQQQQQQRLHGQSQQQQTQTQAQRQNPAPESQSRQSVSLASSPAKSSVTNASNRARVASAPLTKSYRATRDSDSVSTSSTTTTTGPGRAHWKPDSSTLVCTWPGCRLEFGFFDRRHHCRKCGDIFCSAHCSKEVPLDQTLDFNPAEGVMSRACVGCYEAYEQWQGIIPSPDNIQTRLHSAFRESHEAIHPTNTANTESSSSSSHTNMFYDSSSKYNGQFHDRPQGDDESRAETNNIAIKRRPSKDQTMMPMPSVPHDWSWSTF